MGLFLFASAANDVDASSSFRMPRLIGIVLGSLALVLITVTAVFQEKLISGRLSRRRLLQAAWLIYSLCVLSGLWLFLALAGAHARGATDIYALNIRVPGLALIATFLAGTIVLLALLPGIASRPAAPEKDCSLGAPLSARSPLPAGAPVEVFLCHGAGDEGQRDQLEHHLKPLADRGFFRLWHAGMVQAGQDATVETGAHLERAEVVIALVTAELIGSPEVMAQLARARARHAIVVPVLAKPCVWEVTELATLKPLPSSGEPVISWRDTDAAWLDVVHGLVDIVSRRGAAAPAL